MTRYRPRHPEVEAHRVPPADAPVEEWLRFLNDLSWGGPHPFDERGVELTPGTWAAPGQRIVLVGRAAYRMDDETFRTFFEEVPD
jgi:hypothetical protein